MDFVTPNPKKTCKIVGRNTACACATVHDAIYAMKKKYVEGREKIRMNAGQLHVTSVFRAAPRPSRLIAMNRSRSFKAGVVSGKVNKAR